MRNALAVIFALLTIGADARGKVEVAPKRTLPHERECAVPLPGDFWDEPTAEAFRKAELWAWTERICLGRWADMRDAAGRSGQREECLPAENEERGAVVPAHRRLRPEFLELILSHEPWASAPRHPQVVIRCGLISGDIELNEHEVAPTFGLHQSRVDGEVGLVGSKFERAVSFRGSRVTGKLDADRMLVGSGLYLDGGAVFGDVDLVGSRIGGNLEFTGSTVTGKLHADRVVVEGGLHVRHGARFAEIRLYGARVSGDVDFNGAAVVGTLGGNRMAVEGGVYLGEQGRFEDVGLIDARIAGDVVFNGSTLTGSLTADRVSIGGALFLRGDFAEMRLPGATVSGDVDLIGAIVSESLNAGRLEVGGSLLARGGTLGELELIGGRILRDADLAGATVTGKLDADGLEVGGNLLLSDGRFSNIDLIGARVVGQARANSAIVAGRLAGDGVEVGGGVFLRNGGRFSDISLVGSRVGGLIHLAGSGFNGRLDLTGAVIDGELHLSSGPLEGSPVWADGATLVLRNARADVLQARRDSWQVADGRGPLPTELTGFVFDRLGGLGSTGHANMGDESAEWLVGWIEAQVGHGDSYDPQPYTQLAAALESAGSTEKAKSIRYAKLGHKGEHDASLSVAGRIWHGLMGCIVGYGVYPVWAIYWFGGLVALGWLFSQFSKDATVRRGMGLWYSLETAFPLIGTTEQFKSVDHGRGWLGHWFHVQKVIGFVLATLWVGALTLLSG